MTDQTCQRSPKFIFITGGVVSSLGKGLCASCIGALLESRGLSVTLLKMDPYLNVDPGTMSPFQHGEVFVTEDGAETDLDLGHYERFTHAVLSRRNNCTSGQIYDAVLTAEREGRYLGKTVQVIPHITDEIKRRIMAVATGVDIVIIEVGGTVGDIEGLPFLEAIREFQYDVGPEHCCYIHLTLVPYLRTSGELKTKPTQHSVNKLREIGIQPHIIICRSDRDLSKEIKAKISMFCNLRPDHVVTAKDVESIYEVPLLLHEEGLDDRIVHVLGIWTGAPRLDEWERIFKKIKDPRDMVRIGIVGKYTDLHESYKSLNEALVHGGIGNNCRVSLDFIDSEQIEKGLSPRDALQGCHGVLVPGGFGERGIEGKIKALQYAREEKIPAFGICLGMQMMTAEFARNMVKLKGANSTEFDPKTGHPVIHLMESQEYITMLGGTMRLGAWECHLDKGTLAHAAYGKTPIFERHRHRYEFNNEYRDMLTAKGFRISGTTKDGLLVEVVELDKRRHPWYLGCQFHPEFKSRPWDPHPLFRDFIKASLLNRKVRPSRKPAGESSAGRTAKSSRHRKASTRARRK